MTPTQLHELVKDVPEVVPYPLNYDREVWYYGDYFEGAKDIDPLHAADLICGRVKRMLGTYIVNRDKAGTFGCVSNGAIRFEHPTELEAVLAAYRASKPTPTPDKTVPQA